MRFRKASIARSAGARDEVEALEGTGEGAEVTGVSSTARRFRGKRVVATGAGALPPCWKLEGGGARGDTSGVSLASRLRPWNVGGLLPVGPTAASEGGSSAEGREKREALGSALLSC